MIVTGVYCDLNIFIPVRNFSTLQEIHKPLDMFRYLIKEIDDDLVLKLTFKRALSICSTS